MPKAIAEVQGQLGRHRAGVAERGKKRHSPEAMAHTTSRRRWFGVGLTALSLVGFGLQACGPSVQFIYEGNIRFEHCYRLDFDENIAPTHRKVCWEDWLARYTKGQTRDRLEYATRRIQAIVAGDRGTLTLQLGGIRGAGGAGSTGLPAPVPTNLHAPPPARMVAPPAVSGEASPPARTPPDR